MDGVGEMQEEENATGRNLKKRFLNVMVFLGFKGDAMSKLFQINV